ncbi:hypothetical protein DY000_02039642 [Brassica cretica]|uniref:Uncharacterized protein n=1 Tax=Brassica cretica TaxID=69181 RepID=A0ABQ7BPK3_BRACR|nr:hypothetical protein DY000_02039642 [Brassica cretica]
MTLIHNEVDGLSLKVYGKQGLSFLCASLVFSFRLLDIGLGLAKSLETSYSARVPKSLVIWSSKARGVFARTWWFDPDRGEMSLLLRNIHRELENSGAPGESQWLDRFHGVGSNHHKRDVGFVVLEQYISFIISRRRLHLLSSRMKPLGFVNGSGERASQLVILLRSLCCRQGRYLPRCIRSSNKIVSALFVVLPGPNPKRSDDRELLIPTHLKVLMLVVEGLHTWPQSSRLALFSLAEFHDGSYSLDFGDLCVSYRILISLRECLGVCLSSSTILYSEEALSCSMIRMSSCGYRARQFHVEMSSFRRLVGKKDRVGFELGIPVWIATVMLMLAALALYMCKLFVKGVLHASSYIRGRGCFDVRDDRWPKCDLRLRPLGIHSWDSYNLLDAIEVIVRTICRLSRYVCDPVGSPVLGTLLVPR